MITEDYVSYELAKLLKEKGFYGECMSMYVTPKPHAGMGNPNEAKIAPHGRDSHYYEGYLYQCEAPTQSTAMKWLREIHNIHIEIIMFWMLRIYYSVDIVNFQIGKEIKRIKTLPNFDSYEEAVEAALKYSLENLI